MSLTLYYHPFSSFCQKVLTALYEKGTAFEPRAIDLMDPESRAELERVWPLAKFPVLRDQARGVTVPESSLIISYLDDHYPGARMIPADRDAALRVELLDRFIDNYILMQVTKVVADRFRAEGRHDQDGVDQATALIGKAYAMLEADLGETGWATGEEFTLADCAAAPALFYSNIILPFGDHPRLAAYYARLRARPSFARAVEEARFFRANFPLDWPEGHD